MPSSPLPTVRYVFDLDGVLVDTEPLVREAYRRVGIEMPADAWGKPAKEWLPGVVGHNYYHIHEEKNRVYERLFRRSELVETSAVKAVRMLNERNVPCYMLTGASTRATYGVLLHALPDLRWVDMYTGCSRGQKLARLDLLQRKHIKRMRTVYIDDDKVTCAMAREQLVPRICVVEYDIKRTTTEDILNGCGDPSRR